jgi:hypothetical protein
LSRRLPHNLPTISLHPPTVNPPKTGFIELVADYASAEDKVSGEEHRVHVLYAWQDITGADRQHAHVIHHSKQSSMYEPVFIGDHWTIA